MASRAGRGPAKSTLPWKWIIEYLASSEQVNLPLLHAVIEGAQLSDDELGENLRELIHMRCLERLCGSADVTETTSGVPPDLDSGSTFDLSRNCGDILSDILRECSFNDFIWTGREPLKSKVRRFIAQKKISMPKPALQQLKDSILDGSHPNADSLKAMSGLAHLSNGHRVSDENVEPSNIRMHEADGRNHDNPDMCPNRNSDSAEHNWLKQSLGGDSSARAPCPSSKNPHVLDAEILSRNSDKTRLRDDHFPVHSPTAKRRKRAISDTAEPECAASVRANESDPERYVDAEEDIAQDSMDTSDEDRAVKDGPLICDEQRGVKDRIHDERMPGVAAQKSMPEGVLITLQELTDGVAPCPSYRNPDVLDAESLSRNSDKTQLRADNFPVRSPTAKKRKRAICDAAEPECAASVRANESDPERYVDAVEDIAQDLRETSDEDRLGKHGPLICDEQRGVSERLRDESVPGVAAQKSMPEGDPSASRELTDGVAVGELPQSETIVRDAVDMMCQQNMETLSSDTDSDGFQNEEINFSMRRNKFLAKQCTSTGDSLQNLEGIRQTICMKCKEGGQLLVCHYSNCPLVIHEVCVDSSTEFNENGDFLCPFCQYSNAISEYDAAKKEATSARKDLGEYICTIYKKWPEKNLEVLAELSEERECSQDEGEHQNPRQHDECVNKLNDRQRQSKGSVKEQGVQNLNGDHENEVNDNHRLRDDSFEDQAEHSQQSSDVNAGSSIEQEEDASDGDATTAGIGKNKKIGKGKAVSSVPVKETESEAFGKITVDTTEIQAIGKVRKRRSARLETRGASREEATEDDIEDTDGEDASVAEYFISVRRRPGRRKLVLNIS